jgi:hypothetical protein
MCLRVRVVAPALPLQGYKARSTSLAELNAMLKRSLKAA